MSFHQRLLFSFCIFYKLSSIWRFWWWWRSSPEAVFEESSWMKLPQDGHPKVFLFVMKLLTFSSEMNTLNLAKKSPIPVKIFLRTINNPWILCSHWKLQLKIFAMLYTHTLNINTVLLQLSLHVTCFIWLSFCLQQQQRAYGTIVLNFSYTRLTNLQETCNVKREREREFSLSAHKKEICKLFIV